ncbi:MAG: hypothetical protein Q9227_006888 [Pyrenula ochraceoflavens]
MSSAKYTPLGRPSLDSEDNEKALPSLPPNHSRSLSNRTTIAGAILLLVSLSINVLLGTSLIHLRTQQSSCNSPFANLPLNKPLPYTESSIYTSHNHTAQSIAWWDLENSIYTGIVRLPDSYTTSKSLITTQRWPWDPSYGIYVLNGYHQLHCIHVLWKTIHETRSGRPVSHPPYHIDHCLETLREETVCQADDTPRWTGKLHGQEEAVRPVSGVGQVRMCRDWGRLEGWARENSACFKRRPGVDEELPLKERYKYCPGGEVYWPTTTTMTEAVEDREPHDGNGGQAIES